jgi:ketosteroid isomerase-like protein
MSSISEQHEDLVRAYFQAVNDERWDDVLALYHDDAVLHVPGRRPKEGKDRIRPFYLNIGDRFDKHVAHLTLLLADDKVAAATVRYDGTDRDGKAVDVYACDNFRFDGGRIRELRIVFDSAGM